MAVAFREVWPTAAGTMDESEINRREFAISIGTMDGAGAFLYWTDDGTAAGLSQTTMAFVFVLVSDESDRAAITNASCCGPKLNDPDQADAGKADQYMFRNEIVSSRLRTTVWNVGEDSAVNAGGGGGGRQFYAYILPE